MASTVSVPSAAVTCRLSVMVAMSRPASETSTVVFGAALASRAMLAAPTRVTRPLVILEVYDGGKMAELDSIDYLFVAPSASVHRIQEAQTTIYQVLWELTAAQYARTQGSS